MRNCERCGWVMIGCWLGGYILGSIVIKILWCCNISYSYSITPTIELSLSVPEPVVNETRRGRPIVIHFPQTCLPVCMSCRY